MPVNTDIAFKKEKEFQQIQRNISSYITNNNINFLKMLQFLVTNK